MEVRYAWNTPGMDEKGVALPAYFTKHGFQPLPAGLNQQSAKIPPTSALPLNCLTIKKLTGSGMVAEGILVALRKIANSNWPKVDGNSKGKTLATDFTDER